ncbi:MAG: thioredoxin [Planctomycetes bacterium]|nr:thioredoxin [Planctomycetota bacterium]
MSAIQRVGLANFAEEVLESPMPVLVDFYADWCGPCRMIAPALEKLAQEFTGRVRFAKVNIDAEPGLAHHFRVQSIPTLMSFHHGQVVDTLVGVGAPGQLRMVLNRLAAGPAAIPNSSW